MRYYTAFRRLIPHWKVGCLRVTQPSATDLPAEAGKPVRLACIRHAASVRPEPGSNSPIKSFALPYFHSSLVKVRDRTRLL